MSWSRPSTYPPRHLDAPSVRAATASNSVAVTLTTKNVAAGHEELRTVSLDTAATAKLLKPPLRRQSPGQHPPSLGGSRLAFARTSPARRPPSKLVENLEFCLKRKSERRVHKSFTFGFPFFKNRELQK